MPVGRWKAHGEVLRAGQLSLRERPEIATGLVNSFRGSVDF
jgi:hypothetical protein